MAYDVHTFVDTQEEFERGLVEEGDVGDSEDKGKAPYTLDDALRKANMENTTILVEDNGFKKEKDNEKHSVLFQMGDNIDPDSIMVLTVPDGWTKLKANTVKGELIFKK
eukprot:15347397-Ditylum_brightwellii.AAC.1